MPLVKVTISNKENIDCTKLMKEISIIAGEETGKGEASLMVSITEGDFIMRGEESDCAFIDVRGIGKIDKEINSAISIRISHIIGELTTIPRENIYLNFTDVPRENWGHCEGVY